MSQTTCCDKLARDDCIAWAESVWAQEQDDTAEPESVAARMKQDATSIVAKRLGAAVVSLAADLGRGFQRLKKDYHQKVRKCR